MKYGPIGIKVDAPRIDLLLIPHTSSTVHSRRELWEGNEIEQIVLDSLDHGVRISRHSD